MKGIRIDGVFYPLGTEAEQEAARIAQERYQARLDAEKAEVGKIKESLGKAEARADAAEAKVKELETRVQEAVDPKRFDAAFDAYRSIRTDAAKVLGEKEDLTGKTNEQIKTLVCEKAFPTIKLDGKDANYVNALYDAAIAAVDADPDGLSKFRKDTAEPGKKDPPEDSEEASRKRMDEANHKAWEQPLSVTRA
jgi:hypothetical protein